MRWLTGQHLHVICVHLSRIYYTVQCSVYIYWNIIKKQHIIYWDINCTFASHNLPASPSTQHFHTCVACGRHAVPESSAPWITKTRSLATPPRPFGPWPRGLWEAGWNTFPHLVAMVLVGWAWWPSQNGANAVNAHHFMILYGTQWVLSTHFNHLDPFGFCFEASWRLECWGSC